MSPLEHVAVLLTLMREIEALMRQENALLREMRLASLPALQADKALMAEAYRIELRALRRSPEAVASLSARVRVKLEQATRSFQAAVRANIQGLLLGRAAIEAVQRGLAASLAAVQPGGPARARRPPAGTAQVVALPYGRHGPTPNGAAAGGGRHPLHPGRRRSVRGHGG
jgi:hypothetical protein